MLELPESSSLGGVVPLRRGMLCATDDFDEYRKSIIDAYYSAHLQMVGPHQRLTGARMSVTRLTDMTLGIVRFGADVLIDPGDVGGYHVDVPISGTTDTSCGTQQVVATPECAAIYTPGEHTFISRWGAQTTQVSIKIDRAALERELAQILGHPTSGRVMFDIGFDLTTSAGKRWLSTLQILLDTLADPGQLPDAALAAQVSYLERSLIVGLLVGQNHSMTEAMRKDGTAQDHPHAVRKVVDLVLAAPGAQYTIADLSESAGVGSRQLQKLFHDRFGMSPSEYVRNVRLDGARSDLLKRVPGATVSEIAFRWGFNHLGRFAQYYERKFGESPSRTLGHRSS